MELASRPLSHAEWPSLLSHIPDPPKQLFARGTVTVPGNKLLAVVGARRGTSYGREVTRSLIEGLRGYPISIVSGLALGVDSYAHESALNAGLHTIAVPGSGIEDGVIYPRTHRSLASRMLDAGGGLLTEFNPTFVSTPWAFPQRNRIMAGMSHATLVIEASLKSGTLITARLATDYNRELLVVPGSIFSEFTEGPHLFLRLGATPVTKSEHILEALGLEVGHSEHAPSDLSHTEQQIYEALSTPKSREELAQTLSLSTPELSMHLTLLELRGILREASGVFVRSK